MSADSPVHAHRISPESATLYAYPAPATSAAQGNISRDAPMKIPGLVPSARTSRRTAPTQVTEASRTAAPGRVTPATTYKAVPASTSTSAKAQV